MTESENTQRLFRRFVYEFEVEVVDRTALASHSLHESVDGSITMDHGDGDFAVEQTVGQAVAEGLGAEWVERAGVRLMSGSILSRYRDPDGSWRETVVPATPATGTAS